MSWIVYSLPKMGPFPFLNVMSSTFFHQLGKYFYLTIEL